MFNLNNKKYIRTILSKLKVFLFFLGIENLISPHISYTFIVSFTQTLFTKKVQYKAKKVASHTEKEKKIIYLPCHLNCAILQIASNA